MFFARREPLIALRFCLCIVERGTIAHGGRIVTSGSVFQLDFFLYNKLLQDVRPTVSLTYCQVFALDRESFEDCLEKHPTFQRQIRKFAMRMAVCRAVRLCAEKTRQMRAAGTPVTDICDAFSLLDWHAMEVQAKREEEAEDFVDAISPVQGVPVISSRCSHGSTLKAKLPHFNT